MFEPLVAALIARGTKLLTGVRGRWIGCGPSQAQRIYYANHSSHMDFPLLWSAPAAEAAGPNPACGGRDYWSEGVFRPYIGKRVFRGVFVERAWSDRTASPIVPMIEALDHGDSLILFPEGTRGAGADLLPLQVGNISRRDGRGPIRRSRCRSGWTIHIASCRRERCCPSRFCAASHLARRSTSRPMRTGTAFLDRLRRQLLGLKAG